MEQRKEEFGLLKRDLEKVKQLVRRNKTSEAPKFMEFPFLVLEPSSLPNTQLDICMQSDLKKLLMKSNHNLRILSDIQALTYMTPSRKDSLSVDNSFANV